MALFHPRFDGELTLDRVPEDMTDRIRRRVEEGLLVPGRRGPRADYRVESADSDAITFAAHGFLTVYSIGLNDVTVRRSGADRVRYEVSYWRWTLLALAHGVAMGLIFLALYLLVPGVRDDVTARPSGPVFFWSLVTLFCLAWPWILSALHCGPAERALRRILRETLSDPAADVSGTEHPSAQRRAS